MNRKIANLQRKIARLAADWRDPHDQKSWSEKDIVKQIDISDDGEVTITLKPTRPHCPCCLLDFENFRTKLLETKGVSFATLNVVDVPASDRWTRTLNR